MYIICALQLGGIVEFAKLAIGGATVGVVAFVLLHTVHIALMRGLNICVGVCFV